MPPALPVVEWGGVGEQRAQLLSCCLRIIFVALQEGREDVASVARRRIGDAQPRRASNQTCARMRPRRITVALHGKRTERRLSVYLCRDATSVRFSSCRAPLAGDRVCTAVVRLRELLGEVEGGSAHVVALETAASRLEQDGCELNVPVEARKM